MPINNIKIVLKQKDFERLNIDMSEMIQKIRNGETEMAGIFRVLKDYGISFEQG